MVDPQEAALSKVLEIIQHVGSAHPSATGNGMGQTAVNVLEAQGRDNGDNLTLGNDQTDDQAARQANNGGYQIHRQGIGQNALFHHQRTGHAAECQGRTDGNIDTADEQHQHHTKGHDHGIGIVLKNTGNNIGGQKCGIAELDECTQQNQNHQQADFTAAQQFAQLAVFHKCLILHGYTLPSAAVCLLMASSRIFSWVASARLSSPVTRPSHMTTIRSHIPKISGISEEIMMMA